MHNRFVQNVPSATISSSVANAKQERGEATSISSMKYKSSSPYSPKVSYRKTVALATPWKSILACVFGLFIGWQAHAMLGEELTPTDPSDEARADLGLFWGVWDIVEGSYVDITNVDEQAQIYGAISGMVNALDDPYSVFMTPDESEEFLSSLDGELEGIGAELTVKEGRLIIVSPLKGSPAEAAGLLPGDHIYLVGEEPTGEMTLWEAIMLIRGEPGTDVTLTILREGVEEPIVLTITRQKIDVPSVELTYEEYEGQNFAHLAIYQFGDDTYNEFEASVRDILLNGPDGLVLDLRMNGGGYLDVSIEMLSEFFDDKRTGVIVKRLNRDDELMETSGNGQLADIPMVVLIDGGSASASEIVAGALQDYDRAVVMGEQSFGKGSVQELKDLMDGSSLRLTIAKWFTPLEQSIDHTGIIPDIVVDIDPATADPEVDVQLDAALDTLATQ